MRDLLDFCINILSYLVQTLFRCSLGGYSYGDFLVAVIVISVFVGTLVISFRWAGDHPSYAFRPLHSGKKHKAGSSKSHRLK